MSRDDELIRPGSEMDLAIDRALEAAKLRAGDSTTTSTGFVEHREPSAVEVDGDVGAGAGDGD